MVTTHRYSKCRTQDHLLPIAESSSVFQGKELIKTCSLSNQIIFKLLLDHRSCIIQELCFTYQFLHNNSMGLSSFSFLKLRNLHSMKLTCSNLPWCLNLKVHVPKLCVSYLLRITALVIAAFRHNTNFSCIVGEGRRQKWRTENPPLKLGVILNRLSLGDCLSRELRYPTCLLVLGKWTVQETGLVSYLQSSQTCICVGLYDKGLCNPWSSELHIPNYPWDVLTTGTDSL